MNRIDSLPHLRSALRQSNDIKRRNLICELRDIAIEYLNSSTEKIPFSTSKVEQAARNAQGLSDTWDLRLHDDAIIFSKVIKTLSAATPSQVRASNLLYACTRVLMKDNWIDAYADWVLDAYVALDAVAADTGRKFISGRKPSTGSAIRKKITALLAKNPELKNPELWEAVTKKLPRGWSLIDTGSEPWLDGPSGGRQMSKRRFENICGEERNKLKH